MRQIRDELNDEIKNMTFDEERAYLDTLLKGETPNVKVEKHHKRNSS